jgi:hypothetical protein
LERPLFLHPGPASSFSPHPDSFRLLVSVSRSTDRLPHRQLQLRNSPKGHEENTQTSYAEVLSVLSSEHFCCRNLHLNRASKKLEKDSNPFFRRQQASHQGLQSLKRPFRYLDRLADLERGIDSHDFFRPYFGLQANHYVFRQCCQAISKVDYPSYPVRTFNGTMLFRIDKFREQIAGKHRLYEPDWPPFGHLAETQARRETLDVKLTPERGRGQMLAFWLRLQTEPKWLIEQRKHGR